jgi:uncharacterized protein YyaL (SSP411 family)
MSHTEAKHSNRLALESSPYLRQHAANPVDWYPWGDEALERARREDKPILLSVGYSACHWCHVMAHESFEHPAIAAQMNDGFINIKVDREERPDLDQLYQGVVQLMRQGGGWPLTVFLTPALEPFFGGTYFPPDDRYGRVGFPKVLEALHDLWANDRPKIAEQARQFKDGLSQLSTYGLEAAPGALTVDDVRASAEALGGEVDPVFGGFGSAPKFPNPMCVALLLRGHRRGGDGALLRSALLTLEKMARGGIYDQLGGGFHRYSVDRVWRVPHFEKMLYDNAQLLHLYAEAHQLDPRPLWRKTVEETVAYLERELRDPGGAFWAAQDADSEGEEGKYFAWTPAELERVLTPRQASLFQRRFHVTAEGTFEHGASVLEVVTSLEALAKEDALSVDQVRGELEAAARTLFALRDGRVKPGLDDKILAGWNGLAIRGLAFAARVFERPEWARLASGAADFVLARLWDGERLLRVFGNGQAKIDAFLEDYGDLASGLTALYQATFEPRWLEAAAKVAQAAVARFWDAEREAYLAAPRDQKDLLHPTYALHDNATPSGASTLTEAQLALAALTGDEAAFAQAERYLRRMREPMLRNPFAFGHLLLAADTFLDGAAEVTLVAPAAELPSWRRAVDRVHAPTVAVGHLDPGRPVPEVLSRSAVASAAKEGVSAAFFCRAFTCEPPIPDPDALFAHLADFHGPARSS